MNYTSTIAAVSGIVERAFRETGSSGSGSTIQDVETAVPKATRQAIRAVDECQADEAGNGYTGSRIPCECGTMMRYIGNRIRTVATLCEQMTLERAYYRCDICGASIVPLDKQIRMSKGRFSESIVGAIGYCFTQLPFECASEKPERLTRINVSSEEAQILGGIGAETDEELRKQAQILSLTGWIRPSGRRGFMLPSTE